MIRLPEPFFGAMFDDVRGMTPSLEGLMASIVSKSLALNPVLCYRHSERLWPDYRFHC